MKISPNIGLNLPEGNDVFDYKTFLADNLTKLDDHFMKIPASQEFIATEGQTVFNLASSYTMGANVLSVEVDGVPQELGTGFTETSPTSITLAEGVPAGATISVTTFNLPAGVNTQLADIQTSLAEKAKQVGISVEQFGAKGDGTTNDTQAFIDAINYCNTNQINLELAGTSYFISGELPFPNKIVIRGKGHSTNLVLNLTAGQTAFKATGWVYSFGFEGLRFSIKSGASKDVGAIRTDYCLRGAYIKDIWSFELYTPFYFGDSVWGILAIDNVFAYLSENINTQTKVAFYGSGNTIMINNIELVGGWQTGLQMDTVFVSKIHKFNISGSSSSIQLRNSIVLNNCNTISVQDGWIEQLDDIYWANGKGWGVYAKDSDSIEINNVLVNSGGIYSDNSDIKATNVKFSQVSGGFRTVNNGKIQTDSRDVKYCDYQDGEFVISGLSSKNRGLIGNPIFKKGISGTVSPILTATNGSLVTIDYFHTDFVSGDASVKATITANNHGLKITSPKVLPNELYTIRLKVKNVSGLKLIKVATDTGTSRTTILPSIDQRTISTTGFYTLTLICSSSTNVINAKVIAELADGSSTGIFVVDSLDIIRGYSDFDPSQHVSGVTFNYFCASIPSGSGWAIGDKVYNSAPAASGYEGWICVTSDGTTSTWKGFGAIQA